MDCINMLLNKKSTKKDKDDALNHMINTYELPFTKEELDHIFTERITQMYSFTGDRRWEALEFVLNKTLINHKNLFLAIIFGFKKDLNIYHSIVNLVAPYLSQCGGSWSKKNFRFLGPGTLQTHIRTLCKLQKYYRFDVTNLDIEEEQKHIIRCYVTHLGLDVKPAKK